MSEGAYLMNLACPLPRGLGLQRALAAAISQGAMPETVILLEHPPVVTLGRRTGEDEVTSQRGSRGRGRRDQPWRQVDLPRARPARRLPDPRPEAPRQGREALRPRPRAGADRHARGVRDRRRTDRGADRRLAPFTAAEDRLHRRPHLPVDHDPRGTRSTSTSTRRRSPTGSRPAGSRTPPSRRWRASWRGRSRWARLAQWRRGPRRRLRARARGGSGRGRRGLWAQPVHARLGA